MATECGGGAASLGLLSTPLPPPQGPQMLHASQMHGRGLSWGFQVGKGFADKGGKICGKPGPSEEAGAPRRRWGSTQRQHARSGEAAPGLPYSPGPCGPSWGLRAWPRNVSLGMFEKAGARGFRGQPPGACSRPVHTDVDA